MNKNAVTRIIIWSIVTLILIGIFCSFLFYSNSYSGLPVFSFSFGSSVSYVDADDYSIGANTIESNKVTDIDLNWIKGNVILKTSDNDKISFTEDTGLEEDDQLRYKVENGKLTIQYCKSRGIFGWFSNVPKKDLEINVPKSIASNLDKLNIDVVSAEVDAAGITAKKIAVEGVSGTITVDNMSADTMKISTVSGEINATRLTAKNIDTESVSGSCNLSGIFYSIDIETVSGGQTIISDICPDIMDVETVSGSIDLTCPENDGFTAKIDKVSGAFNSDFDVSGEDNTKIYGDGSAKFNFDTVSGSINIHKS